VTTSALIKMNFLINYVEHDYRPFLSLYSRQHTWMQYRARHRCNPIKKTRTQQNCNKCTLQHSTGTVKTTPLQISEMWNSGAWRSVCLGYVSIEPLGNGSKSIRNSAFSSVWLVIYRDSCSLFLHLFVPFAPFLPSSLFLSLCLPFYFSVPFLLNVSSLLVIFFFQFLFNYFFPLFLFTFLSFPSIFLCSFCP
jgi:hypothetical protein